MNFIHSKIKKAYNLSTDLDLANHLSVKPSTLSMQRIRGSIDYDNIIEKCSDIDFNWLFKSNEYEITSEEMYDYSSKSQELKGLLVTERQKIENLTKELEKAKNQIAVLKEVIETRK